MAKQQQSTPTSTETNRPIKILEAWPIKAAIWANEIEKDGQTRTLHSVTFERRYKDRTGRWQSAHSFDAEDLPKLALLAAKAFEHLVLFNPEAVDDSGE